MSRTNRKSSAIVLIALVAMVFMSAFGLIAPLVDVIADEKEKK